MKVKLDDKHVFNSDGLSCWISALIESEKGTTYERRVTGYCRSFIFLLMRFFIIFMHFHIPPLYFISFAGYKNAK